MTQSFWQDYKLNTHTAKLKNYDYIIIGGGIAGLSSAYWLLQKDPNLKIGIFEKNQIGSAASGRNAGFVTCGSIEHFIKLKDQFGLSKAVEIWKFSEDNRQLLQTHIIQDGAHKVDFKITGSCTVAADSERFDYYKDISKLMRLQRIDVFEVNALEMKRDYGLNGFEGGIIYAGDGYIHPVKLLGEILNKINVYIHENSAIQEINHVSEGVVVKTDKEEFTAAKVIITVNAYLPLVNKKFAQHIVPGRGQILLTKPLPKLVKGPCYLTKHLCYFRQLPTGELLIGGFRNLSVETEKTYLDETSDVIQNAIWEFVKKHFHLSDKIEILKQWSGIMGYTHDGQMIIGATEQEPYIHYLAGCSGHGLGLNFKAAKILVDGIYGAEILAHLNLKRLNV